jgi:hypothetical protein
MWRLPLVAVSALLSLLLVGQASAIILCLLARYWPALRGWHVSLLEPRSFRELLAICNKYNWRHVKVVGYNNGINHFGQRFPGKTIVSTRHCNRIVATAAGLKADCGATVRQAMDALSGMGLQLPVVPNYSYVCLGTAFFIPIHGSASDYCTLADTITRVLIYDPRADRFIAAGCAEPAFRAYAYNLRADVLLCRLQLLAQPKARYVYRNEVLQNPSGGQLLDALRDQQAANVEIRKASAAASRVVVRNYYRDAGAALPDTLDVPRDGLGRLWDRLEENPVTSFLMHALTRYFAYHVELFFTAEDFTAFWANHGTLPLRKLQLRYIKRDGLPHSPFQEHDCVAVDLFMFRRHRQRFRKYLQKNFAHVQANPGKQSR